MALIYLIQTLQPDLHAVISEKEHRVVAHILERNGIFEIRSWPSDILISIFADLETARFAVMAMHADITLSTLGVAVVRDRSCDSQERWLVPEDRAEAERLLQDAGIIGNVPPGNEVRMERLTDDDVPPF